MVATILPHMDAAATPAARAVRPDPKTTPGPGSAQPGATIAFLGPAGTFTEEALFTQPDYAAATVVPAATLAEALEAVCESRADLAFVPIENSIEGTVNATVDSLVFDVDLLIQREVVLDVHLHLAASPGTDIGSVTRVLSFPHASAQCRRYLATNFPGADVVPTNSTAEAARLVSETPRADTAALAPRLAAKLYGLDVLASAVEDHPDNQTRFVALARHVIPPPTGHDKTSIACFQREDHPGSLHAILSEFAARSINLTKLESRPTKRALGDYCFLIDLDGHLADEVVAECLRVLHAELAGVKFLGSFPAAGDHGPAVRARVDAAWRDADDWVRSLRSQIVQS
jgi:prephenate dehydratase